MALIHELMYQNDNFAAIDAGYHLRRIIAHLGNSHPVNCAISMDIDTDEILLDMETAIPLGIIANELITNAMRMPSAADQPD